MLATVRMAAERVEGARVVYVELGVWWRKSTRRGHRSVAPRSAASLHWEKAEGRDASKRRELQQSTSNLQRRDMPAETLCDLATNSGSSQGRSQENQTHFPQRKWVWPWSRSKRGNARDSLSGKKPESICATGRGVAAPPLLVANIVLFRVSRLRGGARNPRRCLVTCDL